MLDVHPPEHTPHSWRDFLIHIATIVVGLLIAIGLEQSVEAVHHRHERNVLRESLIDDASKAVRDTSDAHAYTVYSIHWLDIRIDQVQQALAANIPLPPPPQRMPPNFEAPDDPAWKAARSSSMAELLTQKEIEIYTDVDGDVITAERYHLAMNDDTMNLFRFDYKFTRLGSSVPDVSHATSQDLKEYLDLLATSKASMRAYSELCQELHGAEAAVLHGATTLQRVQEAEGNPW